jgi:uncharacterized protein HemY
MAQQSKDTELEPLLKALANWAKAVTARQDALESIARKTVSDQEWEKALHGAQNKISGPNQSDIKNVSGLATFLQALSKR